VRGVTTLDLPEEQEAELRALIARIDGLVPSEGAHLTLPSAPGSRATIGNRLGYLRLGIELLRAALDPLPASGSAPARIEPELDSVLSKDSTAPFDLCEIDEAIGSRPPVEARVGLLGHLVAGVGVVSVILLLLLALFLAARWIFT
jgi:hypothetical protein